VSGDLDYPCHRSDPGPQCPRTAGELDEHNELLAVRGVYLQLQPTHRTGEAGAAEGRRGHPGDNKEELSPPECRRQNGAPL